MKIRQGETHRKEIMFQITTAITLLLSPLGKDLAYLDPGSGSILIQLIIASLVGVGFLVRRSWSKITRFFRGESDLVEDDYDDDDDDPNNA
jgi:hypothetical protein